MFRVIIVEENVRIEMNVSRVAEETAVRYFMAEVGGLAWVKLIYERMSPTRSVWTSIGLL